MALLSVTLVMTATLALLALSTLMLCYATLRLGRAVVQDPTYVERVRHPPIQVRMEPHPLMRR